MKVKRTDTSLVSRRGSPCGILVELTNIFHNIYFYFKNPIFLHQSSLQGSYIFWMRKTFENFNLQSLYKGREWILLKTNSKFQNSTSSEKRTAHNSNQKINEYLTNTPLCTITNMSNSLNPYIYEHFEGRINPQKILVALTTFQMIISKRKSSEK